MNKDIFYNRTYETNKVIEFVNTQEKSNKIILLVGKTGIGKSAFVDKVLSNELRDYMSIRVNICKSSTDNIDNLYYINSLYRTMANLATKKTFDSIHSPFQRGIGNVKNLFSLGIELLLDKTVGEGHTIYEPTDERGILRKKDYIISVLRKRSFIIVFDNIQNIDVQSSEILYDILNHVTNTTLILEYTTENELTSNKLTSFYNALKRYNAIVYFLQLAYLDYSEAKKLAPTNLSELQKQELYLRSDGNLVKIQLADQAMKMDDDPIATKIDRLSKENLFVVYLLYLNETPLYYTDLHRMLVGNLKAPPFSEQKLYECIMNLEKEKIIRFLDSGDIRIYHDSIIAQLDVHPVSVIKYLAYGVIKEYYCEKLNDSPTDEIVEHLFYLYVRFSDDELLTIFPQIVKMVRNFKYPQTAINKLISYREKIVLRGNINPKLYDKLIILLVNMCLEYGLWEEALQNLELIYSPKNPYHRALKAATLSLDFTNDDSLRTVSDLVSQATSPREKLTSELCLLSAKMARFTREDSIKLAQKMIDTTEYQNCLEYGFLLSNYAELVDNPKECIKLYKRAIDIFHMSGHDEFASNILVFLCMIYAYEGKINDARNALDLGQSLGRIQYNHLLNNYAVLDILEGHTTSKNAKQLSDALLLTQDPYERILIQCNLLVCYTLISEDERAEQIMSEISNQQYNQFQYEEFLHIVYQNLYFYTKTVGRVSESDWYKQQLQILIEKGSPNAMFIPIAKMQLNGQSSSKLFYSQFPFRVDFLGRWNIEISSELENF